MKPLDLLQVLQKVQVDGTYKQAIMEVSVPGRPGMSLWAPPAGRVGRAPVQDRGVISQELGLARSWWGGGGSPPCSGWCPRPGRPDGPDRPALQKVRAYGGSLLSADEFQKVFNELDKRLTKEVTGARRGPLPRAGATPGVVGELCSIRGC